MLKHVQISPLRSRSDSVSLRSSTSCASSICGSPEPPHPVRSTPSRASSYSSLNEQLPQTTIKVFTNCLKIDIEYKTLGIQWDTTSKEVITQLLRRLKMRHRDPRLFYLSMEVTVRSAGVKTILVLDDDTRPAILQACHPKGDSRFCLQLKPGGLIRIHTSVLQPSSQYKSLVISEETTSDELLQLLLSCYNCPEPVEQYSIYEVCPGQEYQRKLHPDDIPLRAQAERMKRGETCHFLVRRNPSYTHHRRQLLSALTAVYTAGSSSSSSSSNSGSNNNNNNNNTSVKSLETAAGVMNQCLAIEQNAAQELDDDDNSSLLNMSIESISEELQSLLTHSDEDEDCCSAASVVTASSSSSSSSSGSSNSSTSVSTVSSYPRQTYLRRQHSIHAGNARQFQHQNNNNNNSKSLSIGQAINKNNNNSNNSSVVSYNPVYNIREIRTVSHCFSSLGSDKKLLDIQLNARFDPAASLLTTPTSLRLRPQSVCLSQKDMRTVKDKHGSIKTSTILPTNTNDNNKISKDNSNNNRISAEAVNNDPAKGLGHFVYL